MELLKIIVMDFFVGILVVDNIDEFIVGDVVDLGFMDILEGVCFMKLYFYVIGVDNCDGEICEGDVVIVEVIVGLENVDLGIQVVIYNFDGEMVEIDGGIFEV